MSTLSRLACSSVAGLLLIVTACATPASVPVLAPSPPSVPSNEPSASAEPSASPEPSAALPGQQVVPLDCAGAIPDLVAEYDMRLAEPPPMSAIRAAERTAGLHWCRFQDGSGDLWALLLVYPAPEADWADLLRQQGGAEIDGGVEQRYCWNDLAEATHCGIRWALKEYAAELFLNSSGSAGIVAGAIDAAAEEVLGALRSLEDPLPRAGSDATSPRPQNMCEGLALGGSSITGEIPWVEAAPLPVGADDAPLLFYRAMHRVKVVQCEWWQPSAGDELGFDHADVVVVPGGGWAFDHLATEERASLAGVDEASAELVTDVHGSAVHAFALVGDDLVALTFADLELNGLLAEDQPALALRLLEPIVAALTRDGTIG